MTHWALTETPLTGQEPSSAFCFLPLPPRDDDGVTVVVQQCSNIMPRRRLRLDAATVLQGIFLLLGVGVLVPWNAFISAKEYFETRFCGVDDHFESSFSILYNVASVLTLGLLLLLPKIKDHWRQWSNREDEEEEGESGTSHAFWLVMIPLAVQAVAFVFQTVLILFPMSNGIFHTVSLVSLMICGSSIAIANAGIVAGAGLLPSQVAMNPFLVGQSVAGVGVSVTNYITAWWEDPASYWETHCQPHRSLFEEATCTAYEPVDWSVFVFFALASLVLVACLAGYNYVDHYRERHERYQSIGDARPLVPDSPAGVELVPELRTSPTMRDGLAPPTITEEVEDKTVWEAVQGPATCIFLTFFVTLAVFPGWTTELISVRQCESTSRLANDLYVPGTFVLFNLGDFCGRLLSSRAPARGLVSASILRVLFVPLLFLCTSREGSSAIHSDGFSNMVQFLLALTNGALVSKAFCVAPQLVPPAHHERMSEYLTLSVALGLLAGSLCSYWVVELGKLV